MLEFIQCPSCGSRIGKIFELYQRIRSSLSAKEMQSKGVDSKFAGLIDNVNVDMSEFLEAMGIIKICCRMHITTAVIITEP